MIAFEGEGRAGGESRAVVFLLIGVASEVIFFFEQQPISTFAAEEICGGKTRDAAADDNYVGFFGGVGARELMAVADLVADFEVFAFDARGGGGFFVRDGEQTGIDGASGGD